MFLPMILVLASSVQQEPPRYFHLSVPVLAPLPASDQYSDPPVKYSHLHMPLHGTLYHGKLYGLFEVKQPTYYFLHAIDLKKPGSMADNRYGGLFNGLGGYYRHRILFNRLWLSDGLARIKSLSFDDLNSFEDRSGPEAREAYYRKYDTPESTSGPGFIFLAGLVKHTWPQQFVTVPAKGVAGFGTVPTSESTLKTFVLLKKMKHMEVWDTKARFGSQSKRWKEVTDGQNRETIESLFLEDFYVFIRKDAYYFVTESGKLYFAPPPEKGEGSRTMQELWWDAKRPITAVIEDADRDKVWLFAKDKNRDAKYDLFFEMKETVRYELFDPAKLRPVSIEGRAKALVEYLPLIMDKKK